jgi:predicted dehydrogenase
MQTDVYELHGHRILDLPAEGPLLRTGQDANDLIGEAKSAGASLVVVPIARLDPAFFELRTGIAGEMVQKFVTYQVEVAIIGDTSPLESESKSLRDFIRESNRRGSIWFLADKHALSEKLGAGNRA